MAPSNARPAIKIDIVKPIPHKTETANICLRLIASGNFAIPSFTETQLKRKIPIGLPKKSPNAIPTGKVDNMPSRVTPFKETPALLKANSGNIK